MVLVLDQSSLLCPLVTARETTSIKGNAMLSARNQFNGTVKSVKLGNVMAEIIVTVSDIEIVSLISRASAEQLGLKAGDAVRAIVKSTEVMIDK
jgi:molybdopterin-binding protein